MNRGRRKVFVAALLLSLALALMVSWRLQVRAKAEADKALFFSYLRGPLSDYLLAANAPSAQEAQKDYVRSSKGLEQIVAQASPGEWKEALSKLEPAHALESTGEGRMLLVSGLTIMRRVAKDSFRLSLEEELEINAFLTSLKEAPPGPKKLLEENRLRD
jgi:hypothetical protein